MKWYGRERTRASARERDGEEGKAPHPVVSFELSVGVLQLQLLEMAALDAFNHLHHFVVELHRHYRLAGDTRWWGGLGGGGGGGGWWRWW